MQSKIIAPQDIAPCINSILSKYDQPTLPISREYSVIWFVNMFNMRELYIPKAYKDYIRTTLNNQDVRFIVFPVIMYHIQSITHPEYTWHIHPPDTYATHAIVVIYDKQFGYLERFDSGNNMYFYDGYLFDCILASTFSNTFSVRLNGINTPWMICKHNGIQLLQEMEIFHSKRKPIMGINIGFCTLYSVWYVEERLKNMHLRPNLIIDQFLAKFANSKSKFPLTKTFIRFSHRIKKQTMKWLQTQNCS